MAARWPSIPLLFCGLGFKTLSFLIAFYCFAGLPTAHDILSYPVVCLTSTARYMYKYSTVNTCRKISSSVQKPLAQRLQIWKGSWKWLNFLWPKLGFHEFLALLCCRTVFVLLIMLRLFLSGSGKVTCKIKKAKCKLLSTFLQKMTKHEGYLQPVLLIISFP